MRIAIDHDNVMADLHKEWIYRYNKRTGDSVHPDEIIAWSIDKFLPKMTEKEVMSMLNEPGIFLNSEPMFGAIQGIVTLIDQGHNVYILTSAGQQTAVYEKRLWYKTHVNPFIKPVRMDKRIIATTDANMKNMLSEIFDIMIDDYHGNLKGNSINILLDAPYNRNLSEEEESTINVRVKSWKEILNVVEGIKSPIRKI